MRHPHHPRALRAARALAGLGAGALLTAGLAACGSDDAGSAAPESASKKDYCAAVAGFEGEEEFASAAMAGDFEKVAKIFQDQVDKIAKVGTPSDISDEEREGFELQVKAIKALSADDLEKAFKDATSGGDSEDPFEANLSKAEKKKVDAYNSYESKTCPDS